MTFPIHPFCIAIGLTAALLVLTHQVLKRQAKGAGIGWLPCIAAALLWVLGWRLAESRSLETHNTIMQTVMGMAPTYSLGMRDRGIEMITSDTPADDVVYLDLIEAQKSWLAFNPAIADIYVMGKRVDGQVVLLVDSETDYDNNNVFEGEREQRTAIGEEYNEDRETLEEAFAGKSIFTTEIVNDRWGSWISAYEPIKSDDGTVIGVLGIDFPAQRWELAMLHTVWGTVAQIGIGVVALIAMSGGHGLWRSTIAQERFEAERAERLRAEAEAKSKAKGEFLAHVTHELRTPMSAIQGYAEMLADETCLASEKAAALDTIRDQCEHLLSLIGDVLDISKIEAGRMEIEAGECSIVEVGESTVQSLALKAREKGVALSLEVAYPVPEVVPFHRMRLRQVLLNLAGNAVKFTSDGSVMIRVSCDALNSQLVVEVKDTGIGMTPEQVSRLFSSFVQGSVATANKYGGTGLGLVISKQLIELMGGAIDVQSMAGQGTTMRVVLPMSLKDVALFDAPRAVIARKDPAATITTPLVGRVLVVEDSPDIQRLIAFVLGRAGATVVTASDGKVALDLALDDMRRGTPFDLVLTDLDLPSLSGLDLVKALRAASFIGRISALTAHSQGERSKDCRDAGCDDFITKPIDRATFLRKVAVLLDHRPSQAA